MFTLLRYFSVASVVALIVVAIILAFFYREQAVDDLIDLTERKNEALARSFANATWPTYATYEAFLERIHPEDREVVEEADAQALRQWDPVSFEYRVVLPSGEERTIYERNQVTVEGDGNAIRLTGTMQDISERKRVGRALERSEASLANAQLGSWESDLQTGKQYWSEDANRVLGLEQDDIEPSQEVYIALVHPADRRVLEDAIEQAMRRHEPVSVDYWFVLPDGRERLIHEIDQATRDAAGKPVSVAGILQDITERNQAEDALRESQEHLSTVVATAPVILWRWIAVA
jgi:PAS domain S-box-containing protein